jgi:hypothetical protein
VADDVEAEAAPRIDDASVGDELDEVGRFLVVDVVRGDELEPHSGCDDTLLEVLGGELEAMSEELDDEVVPGPVVRCQHARQGI